MTIMANGHGGKRPGAGRPKGAFGKKRRILEGIRADMAKDDAEIIDPVKFMLAVANQDELPLELRVDCAGKSAPYVRRKLQAEPNENDKQGELFIELVQYNGNDNAEGDTPPA